MGTRRFNIVRSQVGARAVLYWPAPGECVWLECWVPKKVRGKSHVEDFVTDALRAIPAPHHLHFFSSIPSFQKLARVHGFEPCGESPWFHDCIAFRHTTREQHPPSAISVREQMGRIPALKVAVSERAAWDILSLIDADLAAK